MGRKISLTAKQEMQIISFFENSHEMFICPDNIENSAIIALFRACRDYCTEISGTFGKRPVDVDREKCRNDLIKRLNELSIRYYYKL